MAFAVKSATTIRDDILRTIRSGMIRRGIANPNVGPGSDYWLLASAVANELEVVESNSLIKADELMPDTAVDEGLRRGAAAYGITPRAASGSTGFVVLESSADAPVIAGTELTDPAGARYTVTTGGTYTNGALVPIAAVDTGSATNLEPGTSLQWASAPAYSAPTALVSDAGLTGGTDEEDEETLRARWLARLQTPPGGGNWQHVAELAEASTGAVQKAFVYPAIQGPGTVHVAVAGYASETTRSREIDPVVVANTVAQYVRGSLPEHADVTVTPVADQPVDFTLGLAIPTAPTPGGWLDTMPWPSEKATVDAAPSSTTLIVTYAGNNPILFSSRIAWLSPVDWRLYTATVIGRT